MNSYSEAREDGLGKLNPNDSHDIVKMFFFFCILSVRKNYQEFLSFTLLNLCLNYNLVTYISVFQIKYNPRSTKWHVFPLISSMPLHFRDALPVMPFALLLLFTSPLDVTHPWWPWFATMLKDQFHDYLDVLYDNFTVTRIVI